MPRAVGIVCWVIVAWLALATGTFAAQQGRAEQDRARGDFGQPSQPAVTTTQPEPPSRKITPRAENDADAGSHADQRKSGGSLWTTFGSLAIVVSMILVIARSWKKHGPRIAGGIPTEVVELLGKKHLDPKQSLHLVRLGSRILLLGSSAGGLRTLAEVTDPVDVDLLAGLCRTSEVDGTLTQTFRSLFHRQSPKQGEVSIESLPGDDRDQGVDELNRVLRPNREHVDG